MRLFLLVDRVLTVSMQCTEVWQCIIIQYIGLYEEDEYGGMEGTLNKLIKADPNFGENSTF